jgi:hypothetical protein
MKIKKILLLVCVLTALISPVYSSENQQLIDIGLKFLDNPGDFFFNLHTSNEDYSPLPNDENGSIRFNLIPTFLPFTWGNLNLKVNVAQDNGILPQVDLVGSYGDILALKALETSDGIKPEFTDCSVGLVLSKQMNEKTKLFAGGKYSAIQMKVSLSSSSAITSGSFHLDSLDFKVNDTFFFTGISHQSGEDRYVIAQCGYGFTYKKIIARVAVSRKHYEYGLDIFPEGLFVIHPFIGWHWYF